MTGGQTIDYEALNQEAMRGVVRTILTRTAKSGLPGDHHFYISFDTQAPGVILSKRLKEKYPQEMTIVLQHRFWDLAVTDERFEVKLTFDGIPERLVVPFTAIKVFFDPSVRYGLQFEEPGEIDGATARESGDEHGDDRTGTARPVTQRKPRPQPRAKTRPEREPAAGESKATTLKPVPPRAPVTAAPAPVAAERHAPDRASEPPKAKPADKVAAPAAASALKPDAGATESKPAALAPVAPAQGAQIVSLDAFRKK